MEFKGSNNDLFSSLVNTGLENLTDTPIFHREQNKKVIRKVETKIKAVEKIYEKKIECPVCSRKLPVKIVKSNYIRIESRDTDFMINYKDPNPLFYDIWVCLECGYASPSARFSKISNIKREKVIKNICTKWKGKKAYPYYYNEDTAIEMHQLALLNSVIKQDKDGEKAHLCLKLAWLYRIKNDLANEKKYLKEALVGFLKAYEFETMPVAGLEECSLMYLIGELYRRTDDKSNALKWLGLVIVHKRAKPKIKNMARDQKDLLKELY